MSKLDRKSKSRRIRIEHEAELVPEDTALYLEGLARGLRDGRIALYEGAPAFEIDAGSNILIEGRTRQRRRGMRIDLRVSLRALILGDELENEEEEETDHDKEPEREGEKEGPAAASLGSQAVAQRAESSMPEAIQTEPSADGAASELPTAVEAPSDQGALGAQAPPETNDAVASPRPQAASGEGAIPGFATSSAVAAQSEAEQSPPRPGGSMPDEMSF
jgi:hypothetical protein